MKKNAKFNFIDVLIILLVLCVIIGGLYVLKNLKGNAAGKTSGEIKIRYTVRLEKEDKEILDAFIAAKENNNFVYVGERERAEAHITDIEYSHAVKETVNLRTGEVGLSEIENKYLINVVLESTATESDTDIKATGGGIIKVGAETSVKGKGYAGYGFITSLEIIDKEAK